MNNCSIERSVITINLQNLRDNYYKIKSILKSNEKMACVVKANAYGHGDIVIALELEKLGVDFFCVASLSEAIRLRKVLKKETSILVLGFTPYGEVKTAIEYDIIQTITSSDVLKELYKFSNKKLKVHLAIDTGMSRIGLQLNDSLDNNIAFALEHYNVDGIFTHLCTADCIDEKLQELCSLQQKRFADVYYKYKDIIKNFHYKNSAAILRGFESMGNLVRPGIILYGMDPSDEVINNLGLKPLIEWKSVVASVREINPGDSIGYGASFTAKEKMRIATIATGYADGYSRFLSNKGNVIINGQFAPVVGRVCMDQFMVDCTHIDNVYPNMPVTLIGKEKDLEITADNVASLYNTVNYDVVCGVTERVTKKYIN